MVLIDLCSRKVRLLIGGVDFAQSIQGEFEIVPEIDEMAGLRLVSAEIRLVETLTTPESLDPEVNSRWVIGQTITFEVADTAGALRPHPGFGLRIMAVPAYNEYDRTLSLELGCQLTYWRERTPAADCSGIDPRLGLPRNQVIGNILVAAGAGSLFADPDDPTDTLNYPLQKFSGNSFVDQAGLVAAAAPVPRYLWADAQFRVRCGRLTNPTTPTLSLAWDQAITYERTNSEEYARPFERLKLVAPRITVTPDVYPKQLSPEERYATLAALFPDRADVFGPNPPLVLVEGIYRTSEWDGVSTLTIKGTVRGLAKVNFLSGFIGGPLYTTENYQSQTEEIWRYHPKPAGWNSCRPELNPRSNAGLIDRIEVAHLSTGYRRRVEYYYDDRQNLVRKLTQTTPAFGGTVTWTEDISWAESARGSGIWTKTTRVRAPGGNLDNAYNVINGVPKEPVIDAPPQTEFDSPPESPPTAPTGFNVGEEQIEAVAIARARGGGIAEKERTISLPVATSQEQLQGFADFYAGVLWGRAFGRQIELPLPDELLESDYAPLQRWDFEAPDGRLLALRVEEPVLSLSRDRCVVGVEAGLIGGLVGGGGTPLPPYQPTTAVEAIFSLSAEILPPPPPTLPPITAEAILPLYAAPSALQWTDLSTVARWRDLTLATWRTLT